MVADRVRRVASFDAGTKNFACCVVVADAHNRVTQILEWFVTDVSAPTEDKVLSNINSELFRVFDLLLRCDCALVERQLTRLNYKAARVAAHVASWLNICCPGVKVNMFHAKHKTAMFTRAELGPRERKQFCVDMAIDKVAELGDTERLAQLLAAPKRDDLADTYCQALAYLARLTCTQTSA